MCRVLSVSRSGYYKWLKCRHAAPSAEEARLRLEIRATHKESRGTYGAPRVHRRLQKQGFKVCCKRVARIMREEGLKGRCARRRVRTTHSREAPNRVDRVQRQFVAAAPNRLWTTDTTYLQCRSGFVFLVAILDIFSRRVVGWSLGGHLSGELAAEALRRAIVLREPRQGFIVHSDRGGEFLSDVFMTAIAEKGGLQSVSRAGDCYDNAPTESFWER